MVDSLPSRRFLLSGVFVGVLATGLVVAWVVGDGSDVALTGRAAPDFTVELLGGGEFDLASHIADDGRPLVLNLWASWCAPCREEIPTLSAFAETHPDTAVFGIAVQDQAENARGLAAELDPSYPLGLADADFESSYPHLGLPVTYFIDASGVVTGVVNGLLTEERLEELTTS